MLDVLWLIPAFPLAGFVLILLFPQSLFIKFFVLIGIRNNNLPC